MGYFLWYHHQNFKHLFVRHDRVTKKKLSKATQSQAVSEVITVSLHFLNVGPTCWTHRRKEAQHVGPTFYKIFQHFVFMLESFSLTFTKFRVFLFLYDHTVLKSENLFKIMTSTKLVF